MSSKCEDLNPRGDLQNTLENKHPNVPLADIIGGPLAACRPSGYFRVFIHREDPIHKGEKGKVDGINTVFPKIPGNVDHKGDQVVGGEPAEAFDGYIDLDWNSENFGEFSGKFYNTRLGHIFWSDKSSVGVYQANGNESDRYAYEKIFSHPNTANALKLKLMDLKKWADFQKIPHDEVIERFGDNSFLADNYKLLVDNDIEFSDLIEGGMVNYLTADGKEFGDSSKTKEKEEITSTDDVNNVEEFLNNSIDGLKNEDANLDINVAGIGNVESVVKLFEEAPSEFPTAFGLKKGAIVSLKYPHDAVYGEPGVAGQDHIVIEQFSYRPPQAIFLDKDSKKTALSFLNGMRRNSNIKDFIGVVKMPIPNNLNFTNGVSWGDNKLNSVQAAAFFSAFNGLRETVGTGNILSGLETLGGDLASILGEIKSGELKTGSPANLALSSFLAQFALGRAGINVDGNAALTRGTGAAINPNLELLFNGPKLRNFTFQFQFAPNDELDASIMRRIQKFFKMGMSPNRNQQNLVFLGSPNVFRLRYRTQEDTRIKGLPMHKICALTQCEINYAPDNVYQSYEDSSAGSSPVRTVMTMSFTELTPIFQDDYLGKDEIMDKGSTAQTSTFNDIYDDSGMGAMEKISEEDTGF